MMLALVAVTILSEPIMIKETASLMVATSLAQCMVDKINARAPEPDAQLVTHKAAGECRSMRDQKYADGKIRRNGKPFPERWWKRQSPLFEQTTAAVENAWSKRTEGKKLHVAWQKKDGSLMTLPAEGQWFADSKVNLIIVENDDAQN
ncbi:hypothetical protein [Sphingomonas sp.]|uniref:hypothetical protein n=1 Tax=Sphingomonas sp. TaxID=28214 RepID=UPI0025F7F21D|nr:hypothetical protein [Sphingomonas sp.]